jgi:hypothetical protein
MILRHFRKRLSFFVAASLIALTAAGCGSNEPKIEAAKAADIGDEVSISPIEIICAYRAEAEQVWLAGQIALSQSTRMGEGAYTSVRNASDARKAAMSRLYSCTRVQGPGASSVRFYVVAKQIDNADDRYSSTVTYGLRVARDATPEAANQTFWFIHRATYASPFSNVQKPDRMRQASQSKS